MCEPGGKGFAFYIWGKLGRFGHFGQLELRSLLPPLNEQLGNLSLIPNVYSNARLLSPL